MKFPMTNPRPKARWMMAVVLLAVAACQGGTEGDQRTTPGDPTDIPPPPIGAATVTTDQAVIPADGTTLVTARATLTDARGIARVGAPILFTADLGDITWVTTNPDDETDLYPNECLAYTGNDGSAECVFRSGFTPGRSFINAAGPANLGLGAATEVEFTFAETFAGVSLEVLTCPDGLDSGDLPAKKQIAVQAFRPGQSGETVAAEDVRVYYTSTVGIWDRTLQNHTNDATDNTGVSDQFLRIDSDEDGKFVNVVMTAPGAVPVLCQFSVGDFTLETTLALAATPPSIRPDGSAQEIILNVQLTDTAGGGGVASPKVDHQIRFTTPVGVVAPNPLTLRAGGTGSGNATLALSGAETRALVDTQVVTVAASDNVSRAQATVEIPVATEVVTVEVQDVTVTMPNPAPPAVQVIIKAQVTGAAGAVAGRSVSFDFGDGQPNAVDVTDATGIAEVVHTYITPADGEVFVVTAVDLASNVSGIGNVSFTVEAEDTVTVVVANQNVTIGPGPVDKVVLVSAVVTVAGTGSAANRPVVFDFGDGDTQNAATNAAGVASVAHQYQGVSDGDTFTVTVADSESGASGSGTIVFQEGP